MVDAIIEAKKNGKQVDWKLIMKTMDNNSAPVAKNIVRKKSNKPSKIKLQKT